MLSAASLSDCPFENACKLTGSQPYTPSYDSSGRSSGSVGELRSRGGGSSRAGPSSGDTMQSRVRDIYLSALKARDRQDGGAGCGTALETVAVPAGNGSCAAAVLVKWWMMDCESVCGGGPSVFNPRVFRESARDCRCYYPRRFRQMDCGGAAGRCVCRQQRFY
jgi:hypothetical protein